MAEVPVDSHRELKTATANEAMEILHKLRRAVKASIQSRFAKRVMVDNKGAYIMMMELPHLIDRVMHDRFEDSRIGEGVGIESVGESWKQIGRSGDFRKSTSVHYL